VQGGAKGWPQPTLHLVVEARVWALHPQLDDFSLDNLQMGWRRVCEDKNPRIHIAIEDQTRGEGSGAGPQSFGFGADQAAGLQDGAQLLRRVWKFAFDSR
jgi:hypothetical protein